MEFKNLSEISHIRNENIINNTNSSLIYVTTSNILPNKKGIDLNLEMSLDKSGKKFYKNDILVSNIRPYFKKIWKANMDGITSNDVLIFYPNEEVNLDYLYFVLAQDDFFDYATKTSKGTKMPRGDKAAINKFKILLPKLNIQKKIASILSNLDSKIEINNKIISNLESQAQAIFKSWFVDFEPFQDGDFVESELGMIPKGWEVKELGELYPMKSGYAFKSKDWSDNGFPIIKIKNISNGSIDLSNVDYVNCKETLKKAISFKVTGGEIVMALTGATTGKFGVIPYNTSAYINQRAGLFFDKQEIGYGFLYGLLKQKKIINNIIELSQGSAQENLSPRDVNSLKIAFYKNITDIFNLLNYYIKKVSELKFQNTKLAELRDALLPKLMAGEIDVSNIKIEGKEVKNE